ncbi:MAG: putative lipoprotein [Deltaproteobacteria bacterium]
MKVLYTTYFVIFSLLVGGCSISASIGSSIDGSSASISSPFESSSGSSGGQEDNDETDDSGAQQSYLRDIRDFTAAQLRRTDNLDTFRKELSLVAKKHGVSDWEVRPTTWLGIGEGIAASGFPATQAQATMDMLAGVHAARGSAMRRGYHSAQVASGTAISS